MAIESHIFFHGYYESLPEGSRNLAPAEQINSDSPESITVVNLTSGDNTITIPANALGCLLLFDPTSTVVKKIKGNAGDTGIKVHPTRWFNLAFTAGGQANFIINVSANDVSGLVNLYTTIVFF